jgi:hypothetical protein
MLKKTTNSGKSSLPGVYMSSTQRADGFIDDMDDELDDARRMGIFGIVRMRYSAWVDELLNAALQRKLQAKQQLISSRGKVVHAHRELAQDIQEAKKVEVTHGIEDIQMMHVAKDTHAQYNHQLVTRLIPELAINPSGSDGVIYDSPPLHPHVDDTEVEKAALQTFLFLSGETVRELDIKICWEMIREKYPPLVAEEIIQRVGQMQATAPPRK